MTDLPNLQDIKARHEAAEPGPWHASWVSGIQLPSGEYETATVFDSRGEYLVHDVSNEDAAFIAHARSDVPALVAALEAVIKVNQQIVSDWDVEPVPDEFENGKALHASDLLDLINQHLTIGDNGA